MEVLINSRKNENFGSASAAHEILNRYNHENRYYGVYTEQTHEAKKSSLPSLRVVWPRLKDPLCCTEQGLEDSARIERACRLAEPRNLPSGAARLVYPSPAFFDFSRFTKGTLYPERQVLRVTDSFAVRLTPD